VRDAIVEAIQKIADNRLDDGMRVWEMLIAVAIDTGLGPVSLADANDLTGHRRPPEFQFHRVARRREELK
jgi:hypothetical protein